MTFEAGSRIADYLVRAELRHDELGVVYEAVHLVLPRRAALKIMHDAGATARALAMQMLREACILEALSHPGVPRVFECGVLGDRRPWVASELIDGKSFEAELAAGAIAPADTIAVVRQLADVLAHAHTRGVVHGQVVEAVVHRTPDRVFPVCLRGWSGVAAKDGSRQADPANDIAALGAIALRAFTGAAVASEDAGRLLAQHVVPDVGELVEAMLSPEPARRPTAAEVRDRAGQLAQMPIARARRGGERMHTINDDPEVHVRIKL